MRQVGNLIRNLGAKRLFFCCAYLLLLFVLCVIDVQVCYAHPLKNFLEFHPGNVIKVCCVFGLALSPLFLPRLLGMTMAALMLLVLVICGAVRIVARCVFGWDLLGDWIVLVFGTNLREIKEFIDVVGGWTFALLNVAMMSFVATGLVGIFMISKVVKNWRGGRYAALALLVLPYVAISVHGRPKVSNWWAKSVVWTGNFKSLNLFLDTLGWCGKMYRMCTACKKNDYSRVGVKVTNDCADKMTCVFVIGESCTRNHMSIYGYPRLTTPELSKLSDELFLFEDYIGKDRYTEQSLISTYIYKDRYVFPDICSSVGYCCMRLMSYPPSGVGLMDMTLFRNTPYRVPSPENVGHFDGELLPELDKELSNPIDRKVIFLNTLGSHYNYENRYPVDMANKIDESKVDGLTEGLDEKCRGSVNRYDNTVLYTDWFLSQIIQMLRKRSEPVVVVYHSDHGESPTTAGYRELRDLDTWNLPLIVWFNKAYRERYPAIVEACAGSVKKSLQPDQLFVGFLDLVRISSDFADSESFLSNQFKQRESRRIGSLEVDYNEVRNEKR